MIKQTFAIKAIFVTLLAVCVLSLAPADLFSEKSPKKIIEITTSEEDNKYLWGIMKETFDSIYYYRHPVTGILTANPKKDDEMSKCDHIGLSLASIAVGGKLGLISDETARKEIAKTLVWLEKIPTAQGFPAEPVRTSDTTIGSTGWVAVADMGWYPCCLIVVAEAYPEFKPRIMKLVNAIDWKAAYDERKGLLKGVYSVENGRLKIEGLDLILASDQRLAIFIAIASGQVPATVWDRMPRYYLQRYDEKYLKPGEGLGFGEQPWDMGYFLDERGSEVGKSNADLAWVQMNYALDMFYPVWGWSNCLTLERYMGFGDPDTTWSVVNPHAVVPAVVYYPRQVVKAFKKMEELGVRQPVKPDGVKPYKFGLRASYDVDKQRSPEAVLPGLDQPMILLALANYLNDGIVWRLFSQNEMVKRGVKSIKEYYKPNKKYLDIYRQRDADGPAIEYEPAEPPEKVIMVDDFSNTSGMNKLGAGRRSKQANVSYYQGGARIEFFGRDQKNRGEFIEELGGADLTHHRLIKLKIKGETPGKVIVSARISGEGGYRPIEISTDWEEIEIPLRCMLGGRTGYDYALENPTFLWTGMWHDRSSAQELKIEQDDVPVIEIKEISFVAAERDEINSAAASLAYAKKTPIEADGTFERMENLPAWFMHTSGNNSHINLEPLNTAMGKAIVCNYSFDEKSGGWVLMGRKANLDLQGKANLVFKMKATGGPADMEIKFVDSSGATYMKIIEKGAKESGWHDVTIPLSEFKYAWGGSKKERLEDTTEFHFALKTAAPAKGQVIFDDVKLIGAVKGK